jgi:hypothetical protein
MNWVPIDEFTHPHSVWLCRAYYKATGEERIALLDADPEAPSKQYLIVILLHPEEGRWVRSKTKHGDLELLKEHEAADNVDFLLQAAFRPLDFTENLGHDDAGRMMFYERRLLPPQH